jgi:DNA mismatch repair protein MSH6
VQSRQKPLAEAKVVSLWPMSLLFSRLVPQELQSQILRDLLGRMQQTFDKDCALWNAAVCVFYSCVLTLPDMQTQVGCLGEIDCLLSLVQAQAGMGQPMCVPSFVEAAQPYMKVKDLRNPCLQETGCAALCCAVLCCAVLCCAVLCFVVLCFHHSACPLCSAVSDYIPNDTALGSDEPSIILLTGPSMTMCDVFAPLC